MYDNDDILPGIDRTIPATSDPAGPQFLTTQGALEIGRVGLSFLDTATRAADMYVYCH